MRKGTDIPSWAYKLVIVAATVIWGGSFTVLKGALDAVAPGWLLSMRFAAAAVVMAVLFHRRIASHANVAHLFAGAWLGVTAGLAYLVQNIGLVDTTPGKNAFLTATYCVMVPFIGAACSRHAPSARNVAAAVACVVGIGLISMGDGFALTLGAGDAFSLLSAVLFAVNIVQVAQLDASIDVATVTTVQMATCSLVALCWALVAEAPPVPSSFTGAFWAQMAYVVFLSTVFATMAQNVAQRHVEPSQAALLLSLESVFGAIFSVALYGERVTPALLAGFALIFASIVASELSATSRSDAAAGRG